MSGLAKKILLLVVLAAVINLGGMNGANADNRANATVEVNTSTYSAADFGDETTDPALAKTLAAIANGVIALLFYLADGVAIWAYEHGFNATLAILLMYGVIAAPILYYGTLAAAVLYTGFREYRHQRNDRTGGQP